MTHEEYTALMAKQAELNRRKKMLEFTNATAAEWNALAHEYELIDSRANYHYCITRAVHYASFPIPIPVAVVEVEPELEVYDWQMQENGGGG